MPSHDSRVPSDHATAIPAALRARRQWVGWRLQIRDGKPTKVPLNPRTGHEASSTNPATWTDFETAQAAVPRWRCDGVGFVFTLDDPFVGIDLDHVLEHGRLTDWATSIAQTLASYTEVSPSSTGVHIIVAGTLPPGGRKRGQIEMYEHARYFTMTGHHLKNTPTTIEERTAELAALHAEVFGQPPPDPTPSPIRSARTQPIPDRVLLGRARAARNGRKFRQLYDRGDWQAAGYASPSEADLALVALLAFWVGPDPDRIDDLFRRSQLMRSKWDAHSGSLTYGARTIALVCGPVVVG